MSDTDNLPPAIYHRGTSGTISGFTSNDNSLGETNISLQMLYEKIKAVESTGATNYNPAILRELLLQHISDTNNPHHDTFASLGFDISTDLVGSILPGTVPSRAPSYVLDAGVLLPNCNLPATYDLPQYVSDLSPVITKGSDNGDNDKYLVWLDESRSVISLYDFENSKNDYGYSKLPTVMLGIGRPGLLCLDSFTVSKSLDPSLFTVDPHTSRDNYIWSITTTDPVVKLLPTYKVNVNTGNTDLREVTYLWAGLNNMAMGDKPNLFIVFSINSTKLVLKYTNLGNGYIPDISVVYKSGYIEPVMNEIKSFGGVRFLAKDGDTLTVNLTTTGAPDWSNYTDEEIMFGGGTFNATLPNFYWTKFMLGNPNFLSSHEVTPSGITPLGIMINDPPVDRVTTSTLGWDLPLLSNVSNIGMFSLTVCVDHSVYPDSDPIPIFSSDKLVISLITRDNGTDSVSVWNIKTTDGTNSSNLSVSGSGGYLQTIALSSDGYSLRVRVSGGSGIAQIPSKVVLDKLPNSKFPPFNGAVVDLEVYGITDDGSTLDFLVGDTTNS